MRTERICNLDAESKLRVKFRVNSPCLSMPPVVFQGGSSVAVFVCLCVCGFICSVCVVFISSLVLLMPREAKLLEFGISWVSSLTFLSLKVYKFRLK